MRIGIYGGTFNPPHVGHLRAAKYAIEALGLEKLLLIPSCIAPHKKLPQDTPTPRQRAQMVQIAAGEKMEVSSIELDRGGTSFTYETVEALRSQYPNDELVLFVGTDMFLSFDTWREPNRILQNAALGVFYRGDKNELEMIAAQKAQMERSGATVYLVENPVTAISSTQLRRMLTFACAGPFLPDGVLDYIKENGLYGTNRSYRNLPMAELEQVVVELVKPSRVPHVLGCRDTAIELAKYWGADVNDAARAGLLHDITKALDGPLQLTLCREYGKMLDAFSENNPKVLHALTGSLVAQRIFGEREAVVDAICSHTTGKPGMNLLEKIIYIADYIEPNRDFPGVERLRELAYTDLDESVLAGLKTTIAHLQEQGSEISPAGLETLAWFEGKRKEETVC